MKCFGICFWKYSLFSDFFYVFLSSIRLWNELMKWMRIYGVVWCSLRLSFTDCFIIIKSTIYFFLLFFYSHFHTYLQRKTAVAAYVRCNRMRCIMWVWHAIWFCSLCVSSPPFANFFKICDSRSVACVRLVWMCFVRACIWPHNERANESKIKCNISSSNWFSHSRFHMLRV